MDSMEQLKKFKELLDEGIISEEEYEAKKLQVLDSIKADAQAAAPADAPADVTIDIPSAAPADIPPAAASAAQVAPAPKKGPKTGIIIAIAAVAVLAIVGFLFLGKSKPLMENGQYVGSVDKILEAVSANAKTNVDGFTGFTKDDKVGGNYNVDGVTGQDMTMSFTKKGDGDENVAVEGEEVPDTVILTSIMSTNSFEAEYDRYINMGASIYTAIDPSVTHEGAYDQLKSCLSSALQNATGSIGSYVTTIGSVKIYTTVLAANGKVLLVYSFQEP